ncbi:recombinase family protein [Lysinibacillus pakistanensis]|uniref:recombinase family protein n=2 Tax=Lysinibacillus pakistanensis TaxID=759811 RepID=UPI0035E447C3
MRDECSTNKKDWLLLQAIQDLEAQIQQLEQNGATKIYKEKFTGTITDRPQFNELLNELKEGDNVVNNNAQVLNQISSLGFVIGV